MLGIIIFVLIGCAGQDGPTGPTGPTGPAGPGTKTVYSLQFTSSTITGSQNVSCPVVTIQSSVQVYLEFGNLTDRGIALPATDIEDDSSETYYSYAVSNGMVSIIWFNKGSYIPQFTGVQIVVVN